MVCVWGLRVDGTKKRYLVVVWDAWFCEGSKVIFRYGLALLKMYKKRLKALSEWGHRRTDGGEGYIHTTPLLKLSLKS